MTLSADNHQRQMLAAALQDRQKADPANLLLAHTIGLFHYWWAKALEREEQLLMAREVWLTVIANWACVLAEDTFLQTWSQCRANVYRTGITQDDTERLRNQLKEQLQEDLTDYTKRCIQRGQALTEPLYLVFELEITAFQALKRVGGFPMPGATNRKVICGPLLLRRLGLTSAFSDFLVSQLTTVEPVPDVLADLLDIVKGKQSETLDNDTRTQLMQYFSQLGIAAFCLEASNPDRTLSFLEALYPYLNTSANAVQDNRTAQVPLILDTRSPQFKDRNPGYTRAEAPGKLMFRHAVQLAVSAHMRRAQLSVTADPIDIQQAIIAWQNAILLSKKIGQEVQTTAEVQELILGRVIALDQSGRWDEAIAILDTTIEAYSNDTLQRKLVIFLTNRGVKSGNDEQWEASVTDLRRAYVLDAHTSRISKNFIIALRCLATQSFTQDHFDQAEALLIEAVTVLEAAVSADPDDANLKDILTEVQEELERVRLEREIAGGDERITSSSELEVLSLLQEERLDEAEEEAKKALQAFPKRKQLLIIMSRIYAKKKNIEGVIEMQRRIVEVDPSEQFNASINIGKSYQICERYQDAVDSFWKAAVTENVDNGQRSVACQLIADVLMAQERFKEAKAMVARALQLNPENEDAQKARLDLQIIRVQRRDYDSEEELAELLEAIAEQVGEEGKAPSQPSGASQQTPRARIPSGRMETAGIRSQEAAMNTIERYLREQQIKCRRQSPNTFSLSVDAHTRNAIAIQVRVMDNVVFIGASLPEELPEETTVLYNMLRATNLTDIFKLCRTKSGELYIGAEVPMSVLNAEILGGLIRGTVKFVDQYPSDLDQVLGLATTIQQQANMLETSLIKRTGNSGSPRDTIPIFAKRLGIAYQVISEAQFLLIFGLRDYQVSALCAEQSVSFVATIADMDTYTGNLRYLQRMAEINLEMNICKVALDEDDDLCFIWALPALTEELFRHMVRAIETYLTQFIEELDSK